MTLIDEYLRAVALLLPKDKRDDIIEELRELILSRMEHREAEWARPLTDDETEEVLRQIGHPLVVASRYRDGPQHVVGPALYPYWMFAVKAAVTLQVAVAVVIFIVRALTGDVARAFGQAIASGFTGAVMLVGIATIAAWLIERQTIHIAYLDRWRVRDLRFIGFAAWDADAWRDWWAAHHSDHVPPETLRSAAERREAAAAWRAAGRPTPSAPPIPPEGASTMNLSAAESSFWSRRDQRRDGRRGRWAHPYGGWRFSVSRSPISHGLGGVAAGVVLLLWWVGALHFGIVGGVDDFRTLGLEPGDLAAFDWAGLKAQLYLPVLAYVGLVVAQGAVRIAHPDAVRMQGVLDLTIAALVISTVGWLWTLSPLSSAVAVDTLAAMAVRMRQLFENGPPFPMGPALTLLLVIVGFGGVIRAVKGFWELVLPAPFTPPAYRTA